MAYSFYIYYRIDPAKAAVCEPRIRELLAAVRKATGIPGQLMKKRGESCGWRSTSTSPMTRNSNGSWLMPPVVSTSRKSCCPARRGMWNALNTSD
jgi:hypothetical protein